MIKLGAKVRDRVTEFEGVVTGRAEYLHAEPSVWVEGVDNNGAPVDRWYDESRVYEIDD